MTLKEAISELKASLGPLTEDQAAKFKTLEVIAEKVEWGFPDRIDGTPI